MVRHPLVRQMGLWHRTAADGSVPPVQDSEGRLAMMLTDAQFIIAWLFLTVLYSARQLWNAEFEWEEDDDD